ncbi:hypothetical protein CesoFtcFv8_007914 [Champsocephalus esox]|uniref:Uncharacterized protein n=2 Tax=Champsocephalus TaxID=52236 RepID=A0AAN8DSC9_CHAGU|nr:hypothetical protein CesoFtcFv8_007914 [Champsocephalus esox]KAK5928436.1 hypothetical protein CgunFtcFv8_013499 [Champsocephalus gunnari]
MLPSGPHHKILHPGRVKTKDTAPTHEDKRHHLRTWTLATAPRVGPATAEDPALAQTAPAKAARRAAAHAAHPAAPNAPLAACAKGRLVTQAAVSERPDLCPLLPLGWSPYEYLD